MAHLKTLWRGDCAASPASRWCGGPGHRWSTLGRSHAVDDGPGAGRSDRAGGVDRRDGQRQLRVVSTLAVGVELVLELLLAGGEGSQRGGVVLGVGPEAAGRAARSPGRRSRELWPGQAGLVMWGEPGTGGPAGDRSVFWLWTGLAGLGIVRTRKRPVPSAAPACALDPGGTAPAARPGPPAAAGTARVPVVGSLPL